MMTCPRCNKELSDGTKFCDACGTPVNATIFCPNCGQRASAGSVFCQACGASLAAEPVKAPPVVAQPVIVPPVIEQPVVEQPVVEQPVVEQPVVEQPAPQTKTKKKLSKKALIFGGIGLAAIVAVVLVVIFVFGNKEKPKNNYALYLKDQEIFFNDLKAGSASWQLTSKLVDGEMSNSSLANSSGLGAYVYMSEDGKYIFYPDKVSENSSGFNLYYKEVANPKADGVKIDSDIRYYVVNDSATLVTYVKGSERNLYQYNLRDDSKDKIASDVVNFQVSRDGNKIGFINEEKSIYLKYAGQEKDKIASEVTSVEYINGDFTTIYYTKENTLYKQVEGKEKEKIAADINDVLRIYDSGEIYYVKQDAEQVTLANYVIDDMPNDVYITYPEYPNYPNVPDYPYSWEYDTNTEYQEAYAAYQEAYAEYEAECNRLRAEYEAAYSAYNAKANRDTIRNYLKNATMSSATYTLCYFDGNKTTVITDAMAGSSYYVQYTAADDAAVIIYEAYNNASVEKVKLSEITSIYQVESMAQTALSASKERYVTVKATATTIDQESATGYFNINDDGTVIYFIDNVAEGKNYGELYRISISNGTVGKPELYDQDVYTGYNYFSGDDKYIYFKDYKDDHAELYINKQKVDSDVSIYSMQTYSEQNKVVYYTERDSTKKIGTLKVYQDGKATKIADDVHDYTVSPNGNILYLIDYSLNSYKGTLQEWNNGTTRKIDDDVIALIDVYITTYRNYIYY